MMRLQCVCGRKIAAPDAWLGKRVKCPQCGKPVLVAVPDAEGAAASTPALRPVQTAPAPAAAQRIQPVNPRENSRAAPIENVSAGNPPIASEPNAGQVLGSSPPTTSDETRPSGSPQSSQHWAASGPSEAPKPLLAPPSDAPMEMPPADDRDEGDFYVKRGRLPTALGILGLMVAIGAAASCWSPSLEPWTLYIALGGVAISTMGFGLSMSRYRVGLLMPAIGLVASLAVMGFPSLLPKFPRIAPAHYLEKADESRRQHEEAAEESQRRGVLSVESIQLTGEKESLAPEVSYKLINRSGKTIKLIEGSLQFTDREHRSLGGLALNLAGPVAPNGTFEGKNTWTMEEAMQQAIADKKFTAEYRAQTVVYTDGTVKTFSRP